MKLTANGHAQYGEVRSGGSYLSQNDLRLHFGLATAATVERIKITWPSGITQELKNQRVNQVLAIREQP